MRLAAESASGETTPMRVLRATLLGQSTSTQHEAEAVGAGNAKQVGGYGVATSTEASVHEREAFNCVAVGRQALFPVIKSGGRLYEDYASHFILVIGRNLVNGFISDQDLKESKTLIIIKVQQLMVEQKGKQKKPVRPTQAGRAADRREERLGNFLDWKEAAIKDSYDEF